MSRNNHIPPRGFSVVRVDPASRRSVARWQCVECGKTLDITHSINIDPEGHCQIARSKGWTVHMSKADRTYCPRCSGPQAKAANDTDSELKKVACMKQTQPEPTLSTQPLAVITPRPATPDQKQAIRNHLDKHFDDAAGYYLDDMSDARIAELVGVPRIIVEGIREAAYGPIRVDPELIEMRKALVLLKDQLAALHGTMADLDKQVMQLSSRIEQRVAGEVAKSA